MAEGTTSITSVAMLIVDEFRKKARVNLRANRFWALPGTGRDSVKGYMSIKEIVKAVVLLGRGEWRRVYNEVHVRIYQGIYSVLFWIKKPLLSGRRPDPAP